MKIQVQFLGGKKVSATFESFTVLTDQPIEHQGEGSAPGPFDLFLASIATCAGFFIQSFCQTRNIPMEGIVLAQTSERDEKTHLVSKITLELTLPDSFPEKYRAGVLAAANQCTVKKHLQNPPQIEVVAI